jgi:hypothetical protein
MHGLVNFKSGSVVCSFSWIVLILWNLLSFSASFVYQGRKKLQGARSWEYGGGGQQPHNYWWGIPSYTKQSEQKHCNGREPNLQCTTCQVVFTAHLPIDTVERLHWSISSQFASVEFTHDERFCSFWKKWAACTSHRDKLSGLLQAWRLWILLWRTLWLCFIVVPVNLIFHHLLWSLKEMVSLFVVSY